MVAWIRDWSGFIGLVLLGSILRIVLSAVYRHLARRIDAKVPDDLPIGAGAWLDEQVFRRELGVRVLAGESSSLDIDAFIPSAQTIVLSTAVYEKRDASFWAIAAHELGHALVYGWSRVVGWPLVAARILQTSFTEIATVLIVANVLYARRDIDTLAFSLLSASLIAYGVILVDEALASILAVRILARDPRIQRPALVAVVTALLAAFMTYLGGFVGQLVLIEQRDIIIAHVEHHRHFQPGNPIGTGSLVATSLLSVVLVLSSVRAIVAGARRRALATPEEVAAHRRSANTSELGRSILGIAIVWLVWDRPLGPLLAVVCVGGLLASRSVFRLVSSIGATIAWVVGGLLALVVATVLLVLVARVAPRLFRRSTKDPEPPPLKLSSPAPFAVSAGDVTIALYNDPPWYERAAAVFFPALHIAFVIGVYVQLLG